MKFISNHLNRENQFWKLKKSDDEDDPESEREFKPSEDEDELED